jgi:PAS domain S-box-containing protein
VGDTLPSEDEFEGSQVWDLFPEQTTSDIVPLFRRAVEKGELGSVETQFGGRDWKVWATPLRDRDGTIFAGLSFAQDITEQKERERTLRRHRNLLDQTQRLAGAWEVDLRTDEVTWSEALYEIHEVPPGTTIDLDDALGYFPEEARAELRDAFRRCVDEHEPYDLELPLRTAEGNERWVRTVGAPAAVEDGTVVKVAGAFQNITERKEEERKRKQVIRRVTDAIVEVDADWRFTLVNDQAEALYDRTEEELLGKHFWDVFEEALGTRFEDTYRRVMETREPASFVEYYSGLNGWFDITAYPNDDGGLAFYFQEVTERKQQEARLRDLSNSVPGVVFQFFVRPDGTYGFHFVSEHAEDTLGIAPDPNTFYERCLERIPDSHQEAFRTSIEEAVEEKAPWESEVPFVKPSGERRWILGRSIPREQDGEVVFNGVLLDITDRKDAERALERNKERLSMALEGGNIGTWDWDLDTGEVIFNRQWAEMLGYSRDELDFHFSTWEDLVHPEDLPRAMEALNEYIEGERATYAPEIRMRTKGGDWKWIQTIGKVIDRDEDGEIARAAGIHLDIDEQKHYEEQLRTAKREAEEAAHLKSVMLANMSHEVRTPLTSMIGFSGLLASRLDGKAAKLARLIRKSGQRLEETMEAVLQLSQLEAGGYTLDRDSLRLDSLVHRIVDEFELQAEENGVSVHVETPDTPVETYADDTAVRRVLSNLLDNALKFTPEGGEVWVRTYADGAETVVDIEDTGVGIAEEALSDVFTAFKQESEGLTREYEGAGLGLSIVRELVDALGGTITLDSEKGEGTCVTVRLPRTKGSASHTQSVR